MNERDWKAFGDMLLAPPNRWSVLMSDKSAEKEVLK
jgi:hypothetical protein